jgi:hypothetical protein
LTEFKKKGWKDLEGGGVRMTRHLIFSSTADLQVYSTVNLAKLLPFRKITAQAEILSTQRSD